MSVAAAIRKMLAAGLSIEHALVAAEAMEEAGPPRTARQERNRRYYENRRLNASYSDVSDVQDAPAPPMVPLSLPPDPLPNPPLNPPVPPASLRSASPKGATALGKFLPEDWEPSEADWAYAVQELGSRLLAEREREKFRDYWFGRSGAGGRKRNWSATWRNWCRKAAETINPNTGLKPPTVAHDPNQPPEPWMQTVEEIRAGIVPERMRRELERRDRENALPQQPNGGTVSPNGIGIHRKAEGGWEAHSGGDRARHRGMVGLGEILPMVRVGAEGLGNGAEGGREVDHPPGPMARMVRH